MPAARCLLLSILLALCTGAVAAAEVPAPAPLVVRAAFEDPALARRLAATFGHARLDHARGLLQVETDAAGVQRLRDAGLRVQLDQGATARLRSGLSAATKDQRAIGGYACYRTVEETFASMDALAASHPTLVSVVDAGDSWMAENGLGGWDMRIIRATNSAVPGPKPKLMLVASIHAREYTPAELATRFVESLVQAHGTDADATWILDHHEVHALLQANPDGRKQAELGQMWRKNRNSSQCASNPGVDLNRNFPHAWGYDTIGSSTNACSETYRGAFAASEPETWTVVDYVRNQFEDRRGDNPSDPAPDDTSGMFIDLHSHGGLVLWPWGYDELLPPNDLALRTLGRRLAWFNDYDPQQAIGLYPTNGATDDFAYGELGVAAYTMELGTQFFEACGTFEGSVLPDNLAALRYAARVLRAPYLLAGGPEAFELASPDDLVLTGAPVTLNARVDDSRYNQRIVDGSGPALPTEAISGADAYLNVPPWAPGAVALPMLPVDGSFNSSSEAVTLTLPGGVPPGRNTLFVQGHDASGAHGPVAALFVEAVAAEDAVALHGEVTAQGSGAALQAQLQVGPFQAQADANGDYQRLLPPGSYDIQVTAAGHAPQLLAGFVAEAGTAPRQDFVLYPLCALLEDPAEAAAPTPLSAQSPWNRRPGAGIDGGAAWIAATGSTYANNLDVSLTSSVLDLGGYTDVVLRFDSRCRTEGGWDFGIVEASSNGGGSWTEVFRCDGESAWRSVEIALTQLEGNANARLRWRFDSDNWINDTGWAVDNIVLQAGGEACHGSLPPAVVIDDFDADPVQLLAGASTTLSWHTHNASSCSITNDAGEATIVLDASELDAGTRDVQPQASTTYTLQCEGSDGPVHADAAVTVLQPLRIDAFTATPTALVQGDSAMLAWQTAFADGCTLLDDQGSAPVVLGPGELDSGSRNAAPLQDTGYTLACEGPGGPLQAKASISVTEPVELPPEVFADGFEPDPARRSSL